MRKKLYRLLKTSVTYKTRLVNSITQSGTRTVKLDNRLLMNS